MTTNIIEEFWRVMATNDFDAASLLLSPDFEYYMPQTQEYLTGRTDFAGLNRTYPAKGKWNFDIRSILTDGDKAVSEVKISDGAMQAVAITFHTLRGGHIWRQVEYWPDPYDAPAFRSKWTTHVDAAPF